jgi:integrase
MSPNALKLAWERVRRRAGCSDLHFHDLRHEAIMRFFEMGLTTPEVASISGHRDIRMLMRYAHPMRQRIIEQMDKAEPRGVLWSLEPPFDVLGTSFDFPKIHLQKPLKARCRLLLGLRQQ